MVSLLTGALGLAVAGLIVWLVRKDRLHVNHGFGWVIAAAAFALLGFAPSIIDVVAGWLAVSYPPVLALTLAIVVLVIKMLLMDIERSKLEMRNQRLTQRVAMLEAEIRQLSEHGSCKVQEKETPHDEEDTGSTF
ncbi:MAG: DUF2304 domain-containing protein [Pseudomonadota bacterium]